MSSPFDPSVPRSFDRTSDTGFGPHDDPGGEFPAAGAEDDDDAPDFDDAAAFAFEGELAVRDLLPAERLFVHDAARYLECPSLMVRLASMAGAPVERLLRALPKEASQTVNRAVHSALERALTVAINSLPADAPLAGDVREADRAGALTRLWHQVACGATGAAGGFFGFAGLAVELPFTTTLMLRSIASIAREQGEDLSEAAHRLECLAVFSLGEPGSGSPGAESTYYAARSSLAIMVRKAAEFAASRTAQEVAEAISRGSAPALARLIASIASRFNIVVTEKVLAEAIPIVGAGSGALINVAFLDHFNTVARYHFGLRRLERECGPAPVREAYAAMMG